jgi:hypothetical protein
MKTEMSIHNDDLQVLTITGCVGKKDHSDSDHIGITYSVGELTIDIFNPSDQLLNDLIQECQIELRRRAGGIPNVE